MKQYHYIFCTQHHHEFECNAETLNEAVEMFKREMDIKLPMHVTHELFQMAIISTPQCYIGVTWKPLTK